MQIGQPVSLEGGLSLDQALERGLMDHLPAITAAADVAGKEFAIEQVRSALCLLACLLACNVPDPHVLLAVLVGLACGIAPVWASRRQVQAADPYASHH